jgi:2,3-bisphosphoglycerate-dependent phosphoglycerate mutase
MTVTTKLLLLRHAHTDANDFGQSPRMAGWTDTPLSERGEQQLAALEPLIGIAPVVYSSTLPRALRTARVAAGARRIVALRSLREISCGDVDGWLIDDVVARHPDLWQRNLAQDDPDFCWPGGETYRRFRTRVLRALHGIAARHPGERVLVVTHAGAIAQAIGSIHGTTPARWDQFRPRNCSITTLERDPDGTLRLLDFDLTASARRRAG